MASQEDIIGPNIIACQVTLVEVENFLYDNPKYKLKDEKVVNIMGEVIEKFISQLGNTFAISKTQCIALALKDNFSILFNNGFDIDILKKHFLNMSEVDESIFYDLYLSFNVDTQSYANNINKINELFLSMEDYAGTAIFAISDNEILYQSYECGEYDSGYFFSPVSEPEECINDERYVDIYKLLKKELSQCAS